jgi:hypothetical protein
MDRTVPITASVTKIPGQNTLTIYQMAASPFWYVRMFKDGKIFRRSTKTIHKCEAVKFAKNYFGQVQLLKMNMLPVSRDSSFEFVGRSLIQENKARHERGELSKSKIVYDEARLEKDILPVFGKLRLSDITYSEISSYLTVLGAPPRKLHSNSQKIHLSHIKTIFKHGHRLGAITSPPAFPTLKTKDDTRPWFNSDEYRLLLNKARGNIGKTIRAEAKGKDQARNIDITQELYDLIVFMVNSFIRPSDIRVLQHKHVAIVRRDETYLRLTHPRTKGHSNAMISLEMAVEVYEKIVQRQKNEGFGKPDDYVFQPTCGDKQRAYALRTLQRQFDQLLILSDLKKDGHGTSRTLYSLRHTSIMFRLLNAKNLDTLTLARNARTSVDMIDRFYAKPLTAEMKVDILHSQWRPRKAKSPKVDDQCNEIAPKKNAKSGKLNADPAA